MPVKRPKGYCVTRVVRVILYRRRGRGPSRKVFLPPTHPPSLFIIAIRSRFEENPTEKYVIDLYGAAGYLLRPVAQHRPSIIVLILYMFCSPATTQRSRALEKRPPSAAVERIPT